MGHSREWIGSVWMGSGCRREMKADISGSVGIGRFDGNNDSDKLEVRLRCGRILDRGRSGIGRSGRKSLCGGIMGFGDSYACSKMVGRWSIGL